MTAVTQKKIALIVSIPTLMNQVPSRFMSLEELGEISLKTFPLILFESQSAMLKHFTTVNAIKNTSEFILKVQ